ncbi:hypothetical protein FA95DRAFT_1554217, partial [Auriscalpium vulgare]
MPSTHSATITYFGTYIILACAYLPLHTSLPASASFRALVPVMSTPIAILVPTSRMWLGHHTWPQVAVGCSYGLAFALFWFTVWTRGANEYGRAIEDYVRAYIG